MWRRQLPEGGDLLAKIAGVGGRPIVLLRMFTKDVGEKVSDNSEADTCGRGDIDS